MAITKKSLIGSGTASTSHAKFASPAVTNKLTSEKLQAAQRLSAPKLASIKAPKLASIKAPKLASIKAPKLASIKAPKLASIKAPKLYA